MGVKGNPLRRAACRAAPGAWPLRPIPFRPGPIEQGLSGKHTTAGIPIDPEGGDESKGLAGLTVGWTAADQPTAGSNRRSQPAQFLTLPAIALPGPDVQQDVVGKGSLQPGAQVVGKDPWGGTWWAVRVGAAVEEEPC